jgi:hypothetical protein
MQFRKTTVIHSYLKTSVFISYYSRFSKWWLSFLYFFFSSCALFHLSFLNVTVLHYNIFTKAVHNQTSNWLLVGYCTSYFAVELYFHTKHLKADRHKRLQYIVWDCVTNNLKELNIHSKKTTTEWSKSHATHSWHRFYLSKNKLHWNQKKNVFGIGNVHRVQRCMHSVTDIVQTIVT